MTISTAGKHKESLVQRSLTFDVAYTDTAAKELFLLPLGAKILDVKTIVTTAFNDSGKDLLEVGVSDDPDAIINDLDLSVAGVLLPADVIERAGATSVANGGTVAHGLAVTPTIVLATPSVTNEMVSVTAIGATTFTVAIITDAGAGGTTQTIYWKVIYQGTALATPQYVATAANGKMITATYTGENSDASAGAAKVIVTFAYKQGTRM